MGHKRYLVFAYYTYYPAGGLGDFQESFDDLDDARQFTETVGCDDFEIYDRVEGSEVD